MCARSRTQDGYTYVSVLLAAALVATLLVPALEAMQSAVAGSRTNIAAARQFNLTSKMERVLAAPFSKLYAETYAPGGNSAATASAAHSDPAGQGDRRMVVLYRYDASANALSNADTGLLFVRVYYEDEGAAGALDTLVGRWW